MNRRTALQHLGLNESAEAAHIVSHCNELAAKFQVKWSNASTLEQREKYAKKFNLLVQVATALEVKLPTSAIEVATRDTAESQPQQPAAANSGQIGHQGMPANGKDERATSTRSNASSDRNGSSGYKSVTSNGHALPLSNTKLLDLPMANVTSSRIQFSKCREADSPPNNSIVELKVGQILCGRYELLEKLGEGGMGIVYAAKDRVRNHEKIAIKVLRPQLLSDPVAQQRFVLEAQAASRLSHPNVARVFDIGETDSFRFLTMELMPGRSLRDELVRRQKQNRRFDSQEVLKMAEQVVEALAHAHEHKLIHRDVKPENIWLCTDGKVKLMDFGIARFVNSQVRLISEQVLGTECYMAPEQRAAKKDIDHRADQFSLAVVCYELLTGQVPQGVFPAPREIRNRISETVSQAVMRGLLNDPNGRFPTIKEFGKALSGSLAAPRRAGDVGVKLPTGAIAMLIGVLVMLAAYAGFIMGGGTKQRSTEGAGQAGVADKVIVGSPEEYADYRGRIEVLRNDAEQVAKSIPTSAAKIQDQIDDARRRLSEATRNNDSNLADQQSKEIEKLLATQIEVKLLTELWDTHTQRSDWLRNAAGLISKAESFARSEDFTAAVAALQQAESILQTPIVWEARVREAIPRWLKLRQEIDQLASQGDFQEFVEPIRRRHAEARQAFLADDGLSSVDILVSVENMLKQLGELLKVRSNLLELKSIASDVADSGESKRSLQAGIESFNLGETTLQDCQFDQAAQQFEASRQHFASARQLGIDALIDLAKEHFSKERPRDVLLAVNRVLGADPKNGTAASLAKQAQQIIDDEKTRDHELNTARQKASDAESRARKADEDARKAEQQATEAERRQASAEESADDLRDTLGDYRTEVSNLRDQLEEIESRHRQWKGVLLVRNPTSVDLGCRIRWRLWNGEWSDWERHSIGSEKRQWWSMEGSSLAQIEFDYYAGDGEYSEKSYSLDVDIRPKDWTVEFDEITISHFFKFDDSGKFLDIYHD